MQAKICCRFSFWTLTGVVDNATHQRLTLSLSLSHAEALGAGSPP